MRFTLDDNAHEAIRFLMLGAGIVLAFQFAYWGLDRWIFAPSTDDALSRAVEPFRNDHLISGGRTLVIGGMTLMGRFALALLLSLGGAFLLGAFAALIAVTLKKPAWGPALLAGRSGLILASAWCLYAVLFHPPRSTLLDELGITIIERPAFFGEISIPWPASKQYHPLESIDGFRDRTVASTFDGCGGHEQVLADLREGSVIIARIIPEGPDCDASTDAARTRTIELVTQLQELLDNSRINSGP